MGAKAPQKDFTQSLLLWIQQRFQPSLHLIAQNLEALGSLLRRLVSQRKTFQVCFIHYLQEFLLLLCRQAEFLVHGPFVEQQPKRIAVCVGINRVGA